MEKENSLILAVVVPCYKEEDALPETHKRLSILLDRLINEQHISSKSYILYVNDGSTDQTWSIIKELYQQASYACGLNLAGNVGHQNALLAGLNAVKEQCDVAISIDADLQDDINVIPEMIDAYKAGNDIVYGVRKERHTDTFFKRSTALAFYSLMKIMGVKSVYNHADYRLMSQRALRYLCQFRERNLFLRGLVPLVGYQTTSVYYNRDKRFAGESKYPFKKMLNFAIDGITSFSVKPVRMIFWLGCIFILIALCVTAWTLNAYFLHSTAPGWSSLMISIWLVGGVVLISLGIVGEYIGKIYIEVKDRPRYNEAELLLRSCQKATAAAAPTLSESTLCDMGMRTT